MKAQESNNLRAENANLMAENERYRNLIETLLRHQAFQPFIQDISKDPAVLGVPPPRQHAPQPQPPQHQPSITPTQQHPQPQPQQDSKPDFLNFDASQIQIPQPQTEQQVGMAMVPEDGFSKLNINGFNSMNFNGFQRVNAFAVTDVPTGPDPVDLLAIRLPPSCSTPASTLGSSTCDSDVTVLLGKLDCAARRLKSGAKPA
jgi:bZIP-type transcription factor MBZ1